MFQILYSVNIKYWYKLIDKSDKICNLKCRSFFYEFKVESGHEPVYVTDVTKL